MVFSHTWCNNQIRATGISIPSDMFHFFKLGTGTTLSRILQYSMNCQAQSHFSTQPHPVLLTTPPLPSSPQNSSAPHLDYLLASASLSAAAPGWPLRISTSSCPSFRALSSHPRTTLGSLMGCMDVAG